MTKNELNTILNAKLAITNTFTNDTLRLRHLIGEKVKTPDGIGVLLGSTMPDFNGLYFQDNRQWQVWYGTGNDQTRWVSRQYYGNEIFAV